MPKQSIKTVIRAACAMIFLGMPPVHASEYISVFVPGAQKVGEGRFTYFLWDIYDAALYAPKGIWRQGKPFALTLSYLREIEGKKIADRSIEEMRSQGITDEVKLAAWHTQMRNIFPDVDEGISLTGVYTDKGSAVFYKGDKEVGRINDPEFSQAFFNIWLSKNTSAPELRRKLLGVV